jgi:D-3-phosphoglycerate dehydrogenase
VRIAILDDYLDTLRFLDCFSQLAGHDVVVFNDHVSDEDELVRRLDGVEALILIRERSPITGSLVARCKSLRLISQRSVYPHIDVDACTQHGVIVCSDLHPSTASVATAELTWALILASARQLPQQVESLRDGQWQSALGRTLSARRLGVYSYGRIGAMVASYGRAFGMEVVVHGSAAAVQRARAGGFDTASSREEFFATCDVITLHLRLVAQTRGVVTAEDLGQMKRDATMVNTSRAGLIAPGALAAALSLGRPGYAALDVFDSEPVTIDDPLLRHPRVIATPHIGYVTKEEWELQFADVFGQVVAFNRGQPINVVNPEALLIQR